MPLSDKFKTALNNAGWNSAISIDDLKQPFADEMASQIAAEPNMHWTQTCKPVARELYTYGQTEILRQIMAVVTGSREMRQAWISRKIRALVLAWQLDYFKTELAKCPAESVDSQFSTQKHITDFLTKYPQFVVDYIELVTTPGQHTDVLESFFSLVLEHINTANNIYKKSEQTNNLTEHVALFVKLPAFQHDLFLIALKSVGNDTVKLRQLLIYGFNHLTSDSKGNVWNLEFKKMFGYSCLNLAKTYNQHIQNVFYEVLAGKIDLIADAWETPAANIDEAASRLNIFANIYAQLLISSPDISTATSDQNVPFAKRNQLLDMTRSLFARNYLKLNELSSNGNNSIDEEDIDILMIPTGKLAVLKKIIDYRISAYNVKAHDSTYYNNELKPMFEAFLPDPKTVPADYKPAFIAQIVASFAKLDAAHKTQAMADNLRKDLDFFISKFTLTREEMNEDDMISLRQIYAASYSFPAPTNTPSPPKRTNMLTQYEMDQALTLPAEMEMEMIDFTANNKGSTSPSPSGNKE